MTAVVEIPTPYVIGGSAPRAARAATAAAPPIVDRATTGPGPGTSGELPHPVGARRRRGRPALLIAALLLAASAAVGVLVVGSGVLGVGGTPASPSGEYRVIGPGDTLYSIAAEHAPTASPAAVVDQLVELNGGTSDVELGDVIVLPAPTR